MVKICDSIVVKSLENNHILLGVGNELRYHGPTFVKILPWKLKGKIHGIELNVGFNQILAYGERQFLLLNFEKNDFQLLYRGKITDWISSGKWLQNNKICIVTGHLTAIELEYNETLRTCTVIKKSLCQDKTTLYCSFISGNSWADLVVFGGTAMDIIIWKPLTSKIVQRVNGKNGVTLSVEVNQNCNMMITTSDDRSLKIYNYSRNNEGKDYLCTDSFIQSYGHTARVFQGKIIVKENSTYIVTVGEDSNLCVWNHKGQLLFKRLHHFGSPIWNLDYDSETNTIFTVSSDGNCRKFCLKTILSLTNKKELVDNLNIFSEELLQPHKIEKIAFLSSDQVIVGLTNQNILITKIGNKDWMLLENLLEHTTNICPLLKNKCSILKTYKNQVALGAFNSLLIIKFDNQLNLFKVEFKDIATTNYIKSIFFLNNDEYIVCDENGNCKIFTKNFKEQLTISIQKCRDPWITCAFKLEEYLLLSNRQGHLFLYCFENNQFILKDCIKKVNGHFGVTNICLENNLQNISILKTYGHDNTIKILKLNKKLHTLNIISRENIPIVWVEKIVNFFKEGYVAGFNSTDFVLWNKNYGELFSYNCGGGHRFWDCYLNFKENNLKLIYIKKGKMNIVETQLKNISNNLVEMKEHKWHTKECNILKLIKLNNLRYLVSGGEDNILKISKINDEGEFSAVNEMSQHISCIKAIAIYETNNHKLLIFSAGGRAQICVTEFDMKSTLFIEEKCNFMLKATDFEKKINNKAQEIDFDPETRIMAIDVYCNSNNEIEIFAGCSDGYIREFIFRNNKIEFVNELEYNKCILHVKIINNSMLVTASTDGSIKFWDLLNFSSKSKYLYEIKHHESGINSIDIAEKNNHLYIVTGGDDQNVVFSLVKYNKSFDFVIIKNNSINYLHTAQVTGVKITKDFNSFYSTSVDQTVCKYSFQNDALIESTFMCVADIKGLELLYNNTNNKEIGVVYGCGLESF